jgi:hypothetical protein
MEDGALRESNCRVRRAGPHPDPLPEYREREKKLGRSLALPEYRERG